MRGLRYPHAKLMLIGGNSSPLCCILLKALSMAFSDKSFPREDIHVLHTGDSAWNPFKLLKYAYGLCHTTDFSIPAAKYVSPYSLFKVSSIARLQLDKSVVLAGSNMKEYSYECLINALPKEEALLEIEGGVAALNDSKALVFSLAKLRYLDKLAEMCGYLTKSNANTENERLRKLCSNGGDILFWNCSEEPSAHNLLSIEGAIFLKNIVKSLRGKQFASKCNVKVHLGSSEIHPETIVNENAKRLADCNNIEVLYNSSLNSIDREGRYCMSKDNGRMNFDMLILAGRLAEPAGLENTHKHSNVLSVADADNRCLLKSDEVLKVVRKVAETFSLKVENESRIRHALHSLDYISCDLRKSVDIAKKQDEPGIKNWLDHNYLISKLF
eukprot:TRINITY_DN8134_c0_g1_i10.p1 TRINITY_DN8134_c0_g1~~TRINITY_DN8134_c0_g1_i10.p1  ORF type:complete len:427 (+),score=59.54 TRINITY_DN8134_c0_g1_i10:128-1282(+)